MIATAKNRSISLTTDDIHLDISFEKSISSVTILSAESSRKCSRFSGAEINFSSQLTQSPLCRSTCGSKPELFGIF